MARRPWARSSGRFPLPRSAVASTVSAGQTWMVWAGDDPIATITLTAYVDVDNLWKPDRDPEALWYPEDDPVDALYAAKMMIPLRSRRRELRRRAARLGRRAGVRGRVHAWLRLDAWTTNHRLHDYYRAAGVPACPHRRVRVSLLFERVERSRNGKAA